MLDIKEKELETNF